MQFISDFADAAVVLPFVLALWAVMACLGHLRLISLWAASVALVLSVILALKVALLAATAETGIGIISPSGHTASACSVYGGLGWLLLRRHTLWWVAALPALVVTATIAVTRVALLAHSPGEVIIGAAVGLSGIAILAIKTGPRPMLPAWPVVLTWSVCAILLHGQQSTFEKALQAFVLRD